MLGDIAMFDRFVAALKGSPVGALSQRFYDRWLSFRGFLIGLRIAWVSTASALVGLVLFFVAAEAQDLLLEVRSNDLGTNLLPWVGFYLVMILFWALPVTVSARWILTRSDRASEQHAPDERLPGWVRTKVPAFLAALCFVAILTGQLMALRIAPPLDEGAKLFSAQAQSRLDRNDKGPLDVRGYTELASQAAIVVGSKIVERKNLPVLGLVVGSLLALWLYLMRPAPLARLLPQRTRALTIVVGTTGAVAMGSALVAHAVDGFVQGSLSLPWPWILIGVATAAIVLAYLGRERFLLWLGTAFVIVAVLVIAFAVYGIILVEYRAAFGLAHLHLLPFITAAAAAIAWWGLGRPSNGRATRIGQLLLRLRDPTAALSEQMATSRLVDPIFFGLVAITVVLNILFIVVSPLTLTAYINRSSLLPVVLGLPVAAFTLLTYASMWSRVPLVVAVLAFMGVWNAAMARFGNDYYAIRPISAATPPSTLDEAIKRWAKANDDCVVPGRGATTKAADKACPSPVIIAAAGGASRAAFHVAGVVGKLLDGGRFSPLSGHRGIVYSAAFNHDGTLIATASIDGEVRIWDGKTGALIKALKGDGGRQAHKKSVRSVEFSRVGGFLVTASWDRMAKVWDLSKVRERGRPEDADPHKTLSHPTDVNSAAFSPDGAFVVTGSDDGTARIWELQALQWGAQAREPKAKLEPAHKHFVYGVSFSEDGNRVVTASWDGTARVWDVSDLDQPKAVGSPLKHDTRVYSAAFSPKSSDVVVTGAHDKKVRVWNVITGEMTAAPLAHTDLVHSVAFNRDGDRLVTASWDATAIVWDTSSLSQIKPLLPPLVGHSKDLNSAKFSRDGKLIATASNDKTVRIWHAQTGERAIWESDAGQFHRFDKQLFAISGVSGGALGAAVVFASLADSQPGPDDRRMPPCSGAGLKDSDWFAATRDGHQPEPSQNPQKSWKACLQLLVAGDFLSPVAIGLSRDPLPIVSLLQDNRATLLEDAWDRRYERYAGGARKTLTKGLTEIRREVEAVGDRWLPILLLNGTLVEDGRRIIVTDVEMRSGDGKKGVFPDSQTFYDLMEGRHDGPIHGVASSPDGTRIVTASADGTARITELKTGLQMVIDRQAGGHSKRLQSAAFNRDGTRLVTASWDETARIWDVSRPGDAKLLAVLPHEDDVNTAAFSPDGKLVATGSDNGQVQIWDAQSGARKAKIRRAHSHHVYAVAFSPDEKKRLVSASWDKTVKIWDVSNLGDIKLFKTLEHPSDVNAAAFSPDGKLIATGSDDGVARIWDADTGERLAELSPPHRRFVYGVAFSPDGMRLATASLDHGARIWDISSLSAIKDLKTLAHRWEVNGVAFIGSDGKLVVTGGRDRRAHFWDADEGAAVRMPCRDCDVRLSSAVTMSARFPVISPTGTFKDNDGKIRRVVDGGYYENFGATTAMELAKVLKNDYGLRPAVIVVNNDHSVKDLECVTPTGHAAASGASSWLWGPLSAVIAARTARGSHATVSLCYELRELVGDNGFAFVSVARDVSNDDMTLAASWWMSKNVQSYLDEQLGPAARINLAAFRTIDEMRKRAQPQTTSSLEKKVAEQ